MSDRIRLDQLLVLQGLASSREKAQRLIVNGLVQGEGKVLQKPSLKVPVKLPLSVTGSVFPFVSRGGCKLEKALRVFSISLDGCTCLDIGASTGGFTDCMLQHGAALVYAVDVGHNQLDHKLCQDARVVNLEGHNFRYAQPNWFSNPPDFVGTDVSFISLRLILPPIFSVLKQGGQAVCLIKPQFEAGKESVGKNGVVRDPADHRRVIREILEFAAQLGFLQAGLDFSPIQGPQGNIEYLLWLKKQVGTDSPLSIDAVVTAAHRSFCGKSVKSVSTPASAELVLQEGSK